MQLEWHCIEYLATCVFDGRIGFVCLGEHQYGAFSSEKEKILVVFVTEESQLARDEEAIENEVEDDDEGVDDDD